MEFKRILKADLSNSPHDPPPPSLILHIFDNFSHTGIFKVGRGGRVKSWYNYGGPHNKNSQNQNNKGYRTLESSLGYIPHLTRLTLLIADIMLREHRTTHLRQLCVRRKTLCSLTVPLLS